MSNLPTLLFIDDEERVVRALKNIFIDEDYDIIATTDPEEAFDVLKTKTVHVIVSDQRMPTIQGTELLKKAREISPDAIRLLLTGYADMNSAIQAVNEGEIFRYLRKPWSNTDIKQKVAQAIDISLKIHSVSTHQDLPSDIALTLMLLDQDQMSFETISGIIDVQRHHLLWAKNVDQLIDFILTRKIAVLIAETHLEGQKIDYILNQVKKDHPDIVMVILSAFKDKDGLIDLINQAQVYRFVPKPPNRGMLARAVTQAIDYARQQVIKPVLINRQVVEEIKPDTSDSTVVRFLGLIKKMRGVGKNI